MVEWKPSQKTTTTTERKMNEESILLPNRRFVIVSTVGDELPTHIYILDQWGNLNLLQGRSIAPRSPNGNLFFLLIAGTFSIIQLLFSLALFYVQSIFPFLDTHNVAAFLLTSLICTTLKRKHSICESCVIKTPGHWLLGVGVAKSSFRRDQSRRDFLFLSTKINSSCTRLEF